MLATWLKQRPSASSMHHAWRCSDHSIAPQTSPPTYSRPIAAPSLVHLMLTGCARRASFMVSSSSWQRSQEARDRRPVLRQLLDLRLLAVLAPAHCRQLVG